MSTRKSQAATAGFQAAPPGPAAWSDLPRQQMAACTRAACALFSGFEAIRGIQQSTAHQALTHHEAIAAKLKEPCQPAELLALQADMVRYDLHGAAMYWQQVGIASLEMQRELLGSVANGVHAEPEDARANGQGPVPDLNPFFFNVTAAQPASAP